MKIRTTIATALVISGISAGAALAQTTAVEEVVQQLQAEGYTHIDVARTFFGRVKIQATDGTTAVEVVVNPHNGEVLREADMTARMTEMLEHAHSEGVFGMDMPGMAGMGTGNGTGEPGTGGMNGGTGGMGGGTGGMGGGAGGMGGGAGDTGGAGGMGGGAGGMGGGAGGGAGGMGGGAGGGMGGGMGG